MTALTNDHVVYEPTAMSFAKPAVARSVGTSRPSGLEAVIVKAMRFIASIPSRQAVKNELSRLTDRELADIGLSRSEISHVFSRAR